MIRLCFLSILLFLSACNNPSSNYEPPEYEKLADRITLKTSDKIEKEKGLRLIGTGGGMMNKIRMMAMSFECCKEINMEEGRELVIYCVNEYLSAINSNEELRPHLVHYPFTAQDVDIVLYICRPDRTEVPMGTLSVVAEREGVVVYKVPGPFPTLLKRIREEKFEEAVKILNQKKIDKST